MIILFQINMTGVPNLKYKTSLCNAWKEGKLVLISVGLYCQKGNLCFFAHGELELRTMEQVTPFNSFHFFFIF